MLRTHGILELSVPTILKSTFRYERLNTNNSKSKQSKSLDDLCDMDTPTENGQEVLALKKALEWELSLDSRDLRSHAWYHGPIPRQRAEEIVLKEGDFLIRDCVSQPGNYVLTCKSKAPILHFVINKVRFLLLFKKISFSIFILHSIL